MKIGLVFAGGGGKGAYQIGVWKAFKELGIDKYIQGVSGTSIGGLNAVLFSQGNYETAEDIWMKITRKDVLPIDDAELFAKGIKLFIGNKNINFIKKFLPKLLEQGNVSREGLLSIISSNIDFSKVIKSGKLLYVTCAEIPEIKVRYFKLNDYDEEMTKKILCATSAIPSIYSCEEIESIKYVDGGMADNVPIQPLYGEGFDIIFAVHLQREFNIDRNKFLGARIIDIIPSSEQGGIFTGTLDFSHESIKKRIITGYEDTMNLIEPIMQIEKMKLKKSPFKIFIDAEKRIIGNFSGITANTSHGLNKKE